jgi:hypothetical protein
LALALVAGAGVALVAPQEAAAGDACHDVGKLKNDGVKKACADGGQAAAKKLMQAAVKKQKDAVKDGKYKGDKWNCKTCHEKGNGGPLKDNSETKKIYDFL